MTARRFGQQALHTWDTWGAIRPTHWTKAGRFSIDEQMHGVLTESLGVAQQGGGIAHAGAFMQHLFFGLTACFDYPYPSDGDGTFQGFHGAQKTRIFDHIRIDREYDMTVRLAEKIDLANRTGLVFEAWMEDAEHGTPVVLFAWQQRFIPLSKLER